MISLKKWMAASENSSVAEYWHHALALLAYGIGLHAVSFDEREKGRFQQGLEALIAAISPHSAAADVMLAVGSVNKKVEEYNRKARDDGQARQANLRQIVGMLSKTLTGVAKGSSSAVAQIAECEARIEKTTSLEEFQVLKASLEENLRRLRTDLEAQSQRSAAVLKTMAEQLERAASRAGSPGNWPVGTREEAEASVREAILERDPGYFLACSPESIGAIVKRFGAKAGETVVGYLTELVCSRAKPADSLYWWTSHCLLVHLKRAQPLAEVKREVMAFFSGRLETGFERQGHEVLLPIRVAWLLLPVVEYADLRSFADKIEMFEKTSVRQQ